MNDCKNSKRSQTKYLNDAEWTERFVSYYFKEIGIRDEEIREAISVLTDDEELAATLLKDARDTLNEGRGMIGTIGEAHLSYLMEENMNIILTKAGWKDNPLDVTMGIDLIGVCLDELVIVFAEAKTRRENTARDLTILELKKDLSLTRIDPKFNKRSGSASYAAVVAKFKQRIREKKIVPKDGVKRVKGGLYLRIGAVIAKDDKYWGDINDADPGDSQSSRPCQLILYIIEDLPLKLERIIALVTQVNEMSGGDSIV